MAQAINIIHPESSILNKDDNTIFRYNGIDWIKIDSIKLYRFRDILLSDLGLNPSDYSYNDYFEFSSTYTNNCIQSELLSDSSFWIKNNVTITQSSDFFSFPDNKNSAFLMRMTNSDTPTSYSLTQQFRSKLTKHYFFSMFVKNITSTTHSKIAITVRNNSYNCIISAPVDLNNLVWNTNTLDLNVEFIDGTTFNPRQDMSKFFKDVHAHITRIFKDGEYYYRLSIGFEVLLSSIISAGLHLLNDEGEYLFTTPASAIRFYTSGAQMEISDMLTTTPAPYMISYDKPVQNIVTTSLYGIKEVDYQKQFVLLENNKIHFIEEYTESNNRGIRKLLTSKPSITDYIEGDIAVVESVISFGTTSLNIKKTYSKWMAYTYYKIGDYATYLGNLYRCTTTHTSVKSFPDTKTNAQDGDVRMWELIADAVGLGFNKNDSLPNDCICYNPSDGTYRIKKTTDFGDQWLILKYQCDQVRIQALVKSILFGQGLFETWDEQSYVNVRYLTGFNTGGNYNFFKLKKISKIF